MKKKDLINKMVELIEAMNSLQRQLNSVKTEKKELRDRVTALENAAEEPVKTQPEPAVIPEIAKGFTVDENALDEPETVEEAPEITVNAVPLKDSVVEYAAVAIGKVVQESIKYANLISTSTSPNKKEVLNLIMGKAEVAKAEIFAITEGLLSDENKKELIDAQCAEALDYFKSVYAQIAE